MVPTITYYATIESMLLQIGISITRCLFVIFNIYKLLFCRKIDHVNQGIKMSNILLNNKKKKSIYFMF